MKIYIAKNPPEAHFISELLLAEKIPVEVRSVGLFGLQGELPMDDSTQPHVWLLDPATKKKRKPLSKHIWKRTSRPIGPVVNVVKSTRDNSPFVGTAGLAHRLNKGDGLAVELLRLFHVTHVAAILNLDKLTVLVH